MTNMDEPDLCSFDLDSERELAKAEGADPMNPLARPYDTIVTAALAEKARELWDEEDPEGLQEFLLMLGSCYNELSPYNDWDLDIDG